MNPDQNAVSLPDAEVVRRRIDQLTDEASNLKKLLRVMNRINGQRQLLESEAEQPATKPGGKRAS